MISICICTYNRSESLRRTLASLAEQVNAEFGAIELLIVDNNCTDDTHQTVEAFRQRLPIRRVTESRQGLAHARNRAVAEFRGDVLLFTDDDVRFGPAGLLPIRMQSVVFRTPITLADAFCRTGVDAKPRWIRDEPLPLIDGVLGWFDHGAETRLFETTEPLPFGASFAIRRQPVR